MIYGLINSVNVYHFAFCFVAAVFTIGLVVKLMVHQWIITEKTYLLKQLDVTNGEV